MVIKHKAGRLGEKSIDLTRLAAEVLCLELVNQLSRVHKNLRERHEIDCAILVPLNLSKHFEDQIVSCCLAKRCLDHFHELSSVHAAGHLGSALRRQNTLRVDAVARVAVITAVG